MYGRFPREANPEARDPANESSSELRVGQLSTIEGSGAGLGLSPHRSCSSVRQTHDECQRNIEAPDVVSVEPADSLPDPSPPNCDQLVSHHPRAHQQSIGFAGINRDSEIWSLDDLGGHLAYDHRRVGWRESVGLNDHGRAGLAIVAGCCDDDDITTSHRFGRLARRTRTPLRSSSRRRSRRPCSDVPPVQRLVAEPAANGNLARRDAVPAGLVTAAAHASSSFVRPVQSCCSSSRRSAKHTNRNALRLRDQTRPMSRIELRTNTCASDRGMRSNRFDTCWRAPANSRDSRTFSGTGTGIRTPV